MLQTFIGIKREKLDTVNKLYAPLKKTDVDRSQRKLQQGPRQGIQADAPGPAAPLAPHAQADGVVGLLTEAYARNAPAGRAPAPWPVSAFSLFGVRGDGGAGLRAGGREEGELSAAIASARQV